MGIISWIIIGLIVSILTLLIEPYINKRHIPITILIGILGAIAGGAFGKFLGFDETQGMHFMIIVLSLVGSGFLLTWYRALEQYQ